MVGDPVAFVVAETPAQARDAAEMILVNYEPLPAVAHLEKAIAADAPPVWPDCPDNISFVEKRAMPRRRRGVRQPIMSFHKS